MANIKYHVNKNQKVGTPSYWARPTFIGTTDYQSLASKIHDLSGISRSVVEAVLTTLPEAVMEDLLKGYHVEIAPKFLKVYPKLRISVKDTPEEKATRRRVNALSGRGSVGAIVAKRFNSDFDFYAKWEKE